MKGNKCLSLVNSSSSQKLFVTDWGCLCSTPMMPINNPRNIILCGTLTCQEDCSGLDLLGNVSHQSPKSGGAPSLDRLSPTCGKYPPCRGRSAPHASATTPPLWAQGWLYWWGHTPAPQNEGSLVRCYPITSKDKRSIHAIYGQGDWRNSCVCY